MTKSFLPTGFYAQSLFMIKNCMKDYFMSKSFFMNQIFHSIASVAIECYHEFVMLE